MYESGNKSVCVCVIEEHREFMRVSGCFLHLRVCLSACKLFLITKWRCKLEINESVIHYVFKVQIQTRTLCSKQPQELKAKMSTPSRWKIENVFKVQTHMSQYNIIWYNIYNIIRYVIMVTRPKHYAFLLWLHFSGEYGTFSPKFKQNVFINSVLFL